MSVAVATYHDTFAHHYDDLRAGDDYVTWSALLDDLIARWGTGGRRLLDVGCGTGTSSLAFADRGYLVTGCDISLPMLAIAKRKSARSDVCYHHADMRWLPAHLRGYDVVNWMDDVANNLRGDGDLERALAQAHSGWCPAGCCCSTSTRPIRTRPPSPATA